jgi:hypothetical protein
MIREVPDPAAGVDLSRPQRSTRWYRSLAALIGAMVVLRSAGFVFGILNIDEADAIVIAKRVLQGAVPYSGIADIKPPLAYVPYISGALFGRLSVTPVHLLGILWLAATCVVLGRAARRFTGDDLAGACAPWLVLLAAQCELPTVSTELLMSLPLAGALLFYVRAETGGTARDHLLAGLCIGCASLIRHQGGILLGAFGLALCWEALRQRNVRVLLRPVALTVGFVLPWVAVLATFARLGALPGLYHWVIRQNLSYGGIAAPRESLLRAGIAILLCVGAAIVPWILAVRETLRPAVRGRARLGVALAVWLTWIAVSVGGRFYEHYFLQFVAPLAVFAAPQAAALIRSWQGLSRRWRAMTVLACALPALGLLCYSFARGIAGGYPGQEPRARALAAWLAQNTGPDERLFIWGHYPPIYYLANRLPGTRYVTTSVHVGNFDPGLLPDGIDLARFRSDWHVGFTLHDLEANKVPIFVDTAPSGIHHWDRVPLSTVPALEGYLHKHYALVAEVEGSRVYRRVGVAAARP